MAAQKDKIYKFVGHIEALGAASTNYGIIVPNKIYERLPPAKRYRVKGFINKTPFSLAINSLKGGTKYFAIGLPLRKSSKIKLGDEVEVSFHLVDPNIVDVPEELLEVLAQDEYGNREWQALKPGMQRSLAYYVNGVKNIDSRIRRAISLIEKLKNKQLFSQRKPEL
ncbi:MAG TPA: YdeI/OmpD-associated family protein [Bacteroidia bacterium]|nr:YdeI/OmpD-associated family protein [Bacteroidia bacterium]